MGWGLSHSNLNYWLSLACLQPLHIPTHVSAVLMLLCLAWCLKIAHGPLVLAILNPIQLKITGKRLVARPLVLHNEVYLASQWLDFSGLTFSDNPPVASGSI